ncbi:MAG TPA: hypothetical protein DCG54_07485 [Anaerolineae bacterium]|jgi:hypothetical protein|nr:hypothetical protein [Anaerolineae bacterium]
MHEKYYLTKEYPCRECAGTGVVPNPLWHLFWDQFKETGCNMPGSEIKEWFRKNAGWYDEELPAEEDECSQCEGNKVIVERIELAKALSEIGFDFKREV